MSCILADRTEEYYENINIGLTCFCDRCKVNKLNPYEYAKNYNENGVYCQECWNWIHLKKWTDENGNKHTLRCERKVII